MTGRCDAPLRRYSSSRRLEPNEPLGALSKHKTLDWAAVSVDPFDDQSSRKRPTWRGSARRRSRVASTQRRKPSRRSIPSNSPTRRAAVASCFSPLSLRSTARSSSSSARRSLSSRSSVVTVTLVAAIRSGKQSEKQVRDSQENSVSSALRSTDSLETSR